MDAQRIQFRVAHLCVLMASCALLAGFVAEPKPSPTSVLLVVSTALAWTVAGVVWAARHTPSSRLEAMIMVVAMLMLAATLSLIVVTMIVKGSRQSRIAHFDPTNPPHASADHRGSACQTN
jgi:hypothetical protein